MERSMSKPGWYKKLIDSNAFYKDNVNNKEEIIKCIKTKYK